MTREQRSKLLKAECHPLGIEPVPLAEHILENPNEFTEIELWLASNYINAITCLELDKLTDKIRKVFNVKI